MGIRHLLTGQATIVRPGTTTDEYNNQVPDWATATRSTWPARLEQLAGREVTADQQTQLADWILYLPPDAQVEGTDRVEHDGKTFEVVGPPNEATTPRRTSHLEVSLRHVQG